MMFSSYDFVFAPLPIARSRRLGLHAILKAHAALWPAGTLIVVLLIFATVPAQAHGNYFDGFKWDVRLRSNITSTDNQPFASCKSQRAGFSGNAIPVNQIHDPDRLPDRPVKVTVPVFRPKKEIAVTSPLLDSVTQNTPGYSEGYAAGVPKRFAWCSGSYKPAGHGAPPSDFTAVTGWGAIYPKAGAPDYWNPGATIEIANAKTYVRLKTTGEWHLIQDQPRLQIIGAHFVADFSSNETVKMRSEPQPHGSVAVGAPAVGYNNHFWFSQRGTFPAGSVDGVYVQMDMRTNDPGIRLVANVGADWWRDASADFLQNFSNNPGAGMSNWVELSTDWSTLRFYSLSTRRFQENPPPPLVEAAQTRPAFTRRLLSFSPHCFSRPRRIR